MAAGAGRQPQLGFVSKIGQAVALVSPDDGRLLYVNAACERLFGYGPRGLEDRHLSQVSAAPARSPGGRALTIAHEMATAGLWSGDSEGVRADGSTFPCIISLSEFDDPAFGGRVWAAIFLERHRAPAPGAAEQPFQIVFDTATR
jgi:PAS domain S-box-containing protein